MRGFTETDFRILADQRFADRYEAASRHDAGSDGLFVVGKPMAGIYCRPGCSSPAPRPSRTAFYPTAAAAHVAGLRPCPRCRPDTAPRHPDHVYGSSLAARAIRLIDDGEIDRHGVEAVARALGITSRHLLRAVSEAAGCGPLDLARAGRAHLARTVLTSTTVPMEVVAAAAGFATVRQFNGTVREYYGCTPSDLREGAGTRSIPSRGRSAREFHGPLVVRCSLAVRHPFDGADILRSLAARAVPETEEVAASWYARVLRLPRAAGQVRVDIDGRGRLMARCTVADPRDLRPLISRTRYLLDLDADPRRIERSLAADPLLAPVIREHRGLRIPRAADPDEAVLRAIVDDALPAASARTLWGGVTTALGDPTPWGPAFPTARRIADEGRSVLRGDARLIDTIVTVAGAIAAGQLHRGMDRHTVAAPLAATCSAAVVDTVATTVVGEQDIMLATNRRVLVGAEAVGAPVEPTALRWHAERWSPLRGYASALLEAAGVDDAARRTGGNDTFVR